MQGVLNVLLVDNLLKYVLFSSGLLEFGEQVLIDFLLFLEGAFHLQLILEALLLLL